MTNHICIDPGKKGAIAILDNEDYINLFKMPDTEGDIVDLLRGFKASLKNPKVTMEQVSGFIGKPQPGSAMFTFGANFGFLKGVVQAFGMPLEMVTPQKWQKGYSIAAVGPERKRRLKEKSQQLYPHIKITLATCDALLILHYMRNK